MAKHYFTENYHPIVKKPQKNFAYHNFFRIFATDSRSLALLWKVNVFTEPSYQDSLRLTEGW